MDSDLQVKKMAYGCVFCRTGKEIITANNIQIYNRNVHARAVSQTKRYTSQGVTRLQNNIILKGYVFIEAPDDFSIWELIPSEDFLSVLTYSDGNWRLFGGDAAYAHWIYKYDGLLPLSKAYQIGDRIHIVDGPLKDLEGYITRIDKRNRSGQVTIQFAGKQHKVWLGFDIVKECPVNERDEPDDET